MIIGRSLSGLTRIVEWFSPLALLALRIYLLNVFFRSGWLKFISWESTLALFTYEFKVWLVSPKIAAILGTTAELVLPVFLVLGLGARLPALLFFIFNIISVISYPFLLSPEGVCAVKDHILWGVMIAWLLFQGTGKISLDYWIQKKFYKNYQY